MPRNPIAAALAELDSQIADLQRAKELILKHTQPSEAAAEPKVRKPRRKRAGLPAEAEPTL